MVETVRDAEKGLPRTLAALIIEDSPSDAQLIIRHLKRAGFELELEQVESGAQMRLALLRRAWDLVISDYSLPQFDGPAALALLKESGQDIPFIAVSGTMGEETAVAMMRAGANDYVMKDNLARLAPAVTRELEQARVRRARRQADKLIQLKDDLLRRTGEMAKVGGWEIDLVNMTTTLTDEMERIYGLEPGERISPLDTIPFFQGEAREKFETAARELIQYSRPFDLELEMIDRAGRRKWLHVAAQPELENGIVTRIRGIVHDISERKQRELELQRYREDLELINKLNELANKGESVGRLVETLAREAQRLLRARDAAVYLLSPDGKHLTMEHFTLPPALVESIERLVGAPIPKIQIPLREDSYFRKTLESERGLITSDPEVIQQWMLEFTETAYLPPFLHSVVNKLIGQIYKLVNVRSTITIPLRSDGLTIGILDLSSSELFSEEDLQRIFKASGQITAAILRRRDEEKLRESEQKYQNLAEVSPVGIFRTDPDGAITYINPRLGEISGLGVEQSLGYGWLEGVAEEDRADVRARWAASAKSPAAAIGEYRYRRPDGSIAWVLAQATPEKNGDGRITGFVGTVTDITEGKLAQQRIETQLRRLSALNEIDAAITTSLDLNVTLNVLVEQANRQLGMDAACVLLLHPERQTLEFAAGRGFRTRAIETVCLKAGESFAGTAAAQRRAIQRRGAAALADGFTQAIEQDIECFEYYCGAPLVVKGEVKGVLEVFHRSDFEANQEWLEYMDTLAEQAAMAIDNAQLFSSLGRTNRELSQAYDATIEGWSRALDLRDKETEGHTQRVMEMTMRLARAAGIAADELIHVRRGALLHDIGKLGVPDAILLKPAALTPEEMEKMRRHPLFAYEMLAPIAYLRPALDIPYSHHEKWDGSGYPNGLRGEQIPLTARLFAVVDVWDALLSDRPYRPGWEEARVLEHIRALSGTHFDPRVVELFFEVVGK